MSTDTAVEARFERGALLQALNQVAPALSRGSSMPILAAVRIDVVDGVASLTATDLEITVSTRIRGGGEAEFHAVVTGRILQKLIRTAAGTVRLRPAGDNELAVEWGSTKAQLRTLPLDEWPRILDPSERAVSFKLTPEDLAMLQRVSTCASQDDARPILTGILFEEHCAVATDSYRLAVGNWTDPVAELAGDEHVIIPSRLLRFVPPLLATESATVTIDDLRVKIELGEISLMTSRVHGDFPPYERLIPQSSTTQVTVARAAALRAVDAASALLDSSAPMLLKVGAGEVAVAAVATDVGTISTTLDDATVAGPDVHVGFNPGYFRDALGLVDTDTATIEIADGLKPVLIRDEGLLALLMPVRIS